jgi:hypothetical protein
VGLLSTGRLTDAVAMTMVHHKLVRTPQQALEQAMDPVCLP